MHFFCSIYLPIYIPLSFPLTAAWLFTKYFLSGTQVVELDFLYPSEGIHRRWETGYRITSTAATNDQAAFILSMPKRKPMDETQETLRTSAFPSGHVKVHLQFIATHVFMEHLISIVSYFIFCYHSTFWLPWCVLTAPWTLQEKWAKNLYIASICYGRTVCWPRMWRLKRGSFVQHGVMSSKRWDVRGTPIPMVDLLDLKTRYGVLPQL